MRKVLLMITMAAAPLALAGCEKKEAPAGEATEATATEPAMAASEGAMASEPAAMGSEAAASEAAAPASEAAK